MSLGATTVVAGALLGSIPWRWLPSFDLAPIAHPSPRAEHAPERTPLAPVTAPAARRDPMLVLPEEVILRALDPGKTALLRCWTRALAADPLLEATKVVLHLEVDAAGVVTSVTHDAPTARLGNCLGGVLRSLAFAAPGTPAVADVPLFFRPE